MTREAMVKLAIDGLSHHYISDKTAIASLRKWIDTGKVRGVRSEYEGRMVRLYPSDSDSLTGPAR